jgi:acetyl esterase/lipase
MSELESLESVLRFLREIYGKWTRETSIAAMRADWDAAFAERARHWPLQRFSIGCCEAEWIQAPDVGADRAILYLHGGGFRIGSIASHRDLIQRLSASARARVLAIDYRLSPEYLFPAPVEDALAAYRYLLKQGLEASQIALAGDSAGGGLAVSCLLAARDAGLSMPCGAYLMSPWLDMAASGDSYETRAASDPMHQRAMILGMAKGYLGKGGDPRAPLASPIYASLEGLPPLLIQCGGREVILDDATAFARLATAAGAEVTLDIFEPMIHVFQQFSELKSADDALAAAGRFLDRRFRSATSRASNSPGTFR